VVNRSAFIDPAEIGHLTDDDHCVVFNNGRRIFRPRGLQKTKTATMCFGESKSRPKMERGLSEPWPQAQAGSVL